MYATGLARVHRQTHQRNWSPNHGHRNITPKMNISIRVLRHCIPIQGQNQIRATRVVHKAPIPPNPGDIQVGTGVKVLAPKGLPHPEIFIDGRVVDYLCANVARTLPVRERCELDAQGGFTIGTGGEGCLFTK